LADHALGRDGGDAVGAAGGAVEGCARRLLRFGAHDVGNAQPLLVLVLDLDDPQHHHAATGADGPAARVIHRAIPFGGVVNDDEAFRLVTGLVTASLCGHACSRRCRSHAATSPLRLGEGFALQQSAVDQPLRMKPTISLVSFMVSAAIARARSAPSANTASI